MCACCCACGSVCVCVCGWVRACARTPRQAQHHWCSSFIASGVEVLEDMSRHLIDLPSRGLLTVQPGQLGYKHRSVAPKYISLHSTDPPAGQVVRTDPTNILIRSLQRNAKKPSSKRERSVASSSSASLSAASALAGTAPTGAAAAVGSGAAATVPRQRPRPTKSNHAMKRQKPMDGDEGTNVDAGQETERRRQRRGGA